MCTARLNISRTKAVLGVDCAVLNATGMQLFKHAQPMLLHCIWHFSLVVRALPGQARGVLAPEHSGGSH